MLYTHLQITNLMPLRTYKVENDIWLFGPNLLENYLYNFSNLQCALYRTYILRTKTKKFSLNINLQQKKIFCILIFLQNFQAVINVSVPLINYLDHNKRIFGAYFRLG